MRAQYYGWFLSLPDSRLLLERAREVVQQCLSQAGGGGRSDLISHYSRDNIYSGEKCHCTAQFVRKTEVEPGVETDRLGEVSRLIIAAFIITPRTFGARVVLSQSQLELYKQNDSEPFSVVAQHNKTQHNKTQHNKSQHGKADQARQSVNNQGDQSARLSPPEWDNTEEGILEEVEQCSGLDLVGDVKGRRAHITLGCVGPARPVQTGLDQLEVLRLLEENSDLQHTETCQAGSLVSLGQGCWLVALTSPLSVSAVFTGSY